MYEKKYSYQEMKKIEYSDAISINAHIPGIDQKQNTFILEIDGNAITCDLAIASDFFDTIFLAINEYKNNTLVSIKATGIFNEKDSLIRIEGIEAMDVLDPYDVNVRLSYLSRLTNNWYDGIGKAPELNFLKQFGEFFASYYNQSLPLPSIFPTVEGTIQLEWEFKGSGVILEVGSDFISNFLISYDDDSIKEIELNLSEQNGWDYFNNQVNILSNEG